MTQATNIQLKIGDGPDIEGESTVVGHEKEIDILSVSWGVSQSSASATGEGMSAATAQFQSVGFQKYIDKSSPTLMSKCAEGKTIGKAVVTIREAAGDGTYINYLTYTLEPAFVESVFPNISGVSGDKGQESLTLKFRKITMEYKAQTTETGVEQGSVPFSWDVAKQAPA